MNDFHHLFISHNVTSHSTCKRQGMPMISTKSQDLSPLTFNHCMLGGYFVPSHRCWDLMLLICDRGLALVPQDAARTSGL